MSAQKIFINAAEKQSAKAAKQAGGLLNEYCAEDHKTTLRKWHENLQEKRGARASLRRNKR